MNDEVITGVVARGNRLGRSIGFPTVNIPVGDGADVRDGVYEAVVDTPAGSFRAMANIGTRPTVAGVPNEGERIAEANLFDFDGDLYGCEVSITLVRFIRDEKKFGSIEELKKEIEKDKEEILGKR